MAFRPVAIDIYQGDNVSDNPTPLAGFAKVRAAGIAFVIHKASEGTAERDKRYATRRLAWMVGPSVPVMDVDGSLLDLHPRWGAYHFFHGSDPLAEAKNFLAAAVLIPGDEAFVDWENVGASGFSPTALVVDAFCCAVEDKIGHPCNVYGGNVPREQFAKSGLSSALLDRFAARHLWFCSYGNVIAELPAPWKQTGAWLWQDDGDRYGPGPHSIPGIDGYCDNSTVVGAMTVRKLYAEWGGAAATS